MLCSSNVSKTFPDCRVSTFLNLGERPPCTIEALLISVLPPEIILDLIPVFPSAAVFQEGDVEVKDMWCLTQQVVSLYRFPDGSKSFPGPQILTASTVETRVQRGPQSSYRVVLNKLLSGA